MADNVTIDGGDQPDYTVSADEASGALIQRVKLAYSADGSEQHIQADGEGLLVNVSNTITTDQVQYQEGDTDPTPRANLVAWADDQDGIQFVRGSQPLPASLTDGTNPVGVTNNALDVNVASTVTVPISPPNGGLIAHGPDQHDAAAGTLNEAVYPVVTGGVASAAAPTSVNADGDAVQAWRLRNGAAATVITAAGALIGGDAANGLDVDVTRVTGTVTVSDSTAQASLSVMDDWDESDRAKVNPIVGVAGVAAGAGAVSTSVQRVTLASDDPGVTALQIMDDWDESDRAKVNPIAGQAGVAAGAGNVSALTQRVVIATDQAQLTNALKVDGTATTQPVSYATTGSGTATGALRVEIANNGTGLVGLNAGSNAIGKLAANSGVDIGDVDVLSIVPGTGATNLGKAEDSQHNSGDVGVMALAVRSASPSERSAGPTDADYEPLATNEVGALWISEAASANGGAATMNATSSDGGTALTSTAQAIKASAGCLYGWFISNPNDEACFVNFYNTASGSVTVGTTNPLFHFQIPAGSAANVPAAGPGVAFGTAMSWSATKTAGSNTAPDVALDAVCFYK